MSKRTWRYILAYVLLIAELILQTTLIKEIAIWGVSPHLILVTVICFSMVNDVIPAAVFGAVAGLMLDISGSRIIGFNALFMMYLAMGMVYAGQEFFRENSRAGVVLVALGTLAYELVYYIFNFVIFGNAHFWYMLCRVIFLEIVYNSVIGIPVYLLVNKFLKIRSGHSLLD